MVFMHPNFLYKLQLNVALRKENEIYKPFVWSHKICSINFLFFLYSHPEKNTFYHVYKTVGFFLLTANNIYSYFGSWAIKKMIYWGFFKLLLFFIFWNIANSFYRVSKITLIPIFFKSLAFEVVFKIEMFKYIFHLTANTPIFKCKKITKTSFFFVKVLLNFFNTK